MDMDMSSTISSAASAMTGMSMSSSMDMSMDMSSMASDMSMSSMSSMATDMVMSSTLSSAMASATSSMSSMSGMDGMGDMSGMDMDMGGSCKISMLWNWYTIDACFLAKSWHVTSRSMFGGTCVGVICIVIVLEALRRAHREYDRYLVRQWKTKMASLAPGQPNATGTATGTATGAGATTASPGQSDGTTSSKTPFYVSQGSPFRFFIPASTNTTRFSPPLLAQLLRAIIYMFEMAGAYFVMLLAMYYNGYIIVCIFLGALIGFFLFGADTVSCEVGTQEQDATGMALDKGMCCC